MKLPALCIERPVFATVLSLILVVIGVMGFINIKTRFFPHFESNMVSVSTSYPGASAKLIETSITTPLEKTISGLEGIDTLSSVSSQGSSTIKIVLQPDANVYDVTNKIRNAVDNAASELPKNISTPTVRIGHGEMDLMDIGLEIDNNDLNTLRDYTDRYVVDTLQQLPGVSEIEILGANKYAMRITLHPNAMAARHITVADITQAINNNNMQLPAGVIHSPSMNFPITAKTGLNSADEFEHIVIKNNQNQPIYLKDVAEVSFSEDTASKSIVQLNGKPAILLSIYNSDNANPIEVSQTIQRTLKTLATQLPPNIHAQITFDQTTYMKASIAEVYKSIAMAILFVGIIILLTLGNLRAACIPIATIPVCVIATLGCMYFLGFSINLITLLAIVLSIGLVVDDAIVVLENIHRHQENGLTRRQAALKGSAEIALPVIAMTLTLAAVYAPIGLIKGPVAHIFASFAFTLAAAVIISGFVALTLSPMMCAKLLPSHTQAKNTFSERIETFFQTLTTRYQKLLSSALKFRLRIIIITFITVIIGFFFASSLPKTFIPREDMGFLITLLHTPTGANNQYVQQQLDTVHQVLAKNPLIQTTVSLSFDQASSSQNNMIFSTLQDFDKRDKTANAIAKNMNRNLKKIPGLNTITFAPSFGGSPLSELTFYIMAPVSYETLYQQSQALIQKLQQTYPGLVDISSNISFNNQQYDLTVNRPLADQLQVNVKTIDETVASFLAGETVGNVDINGESYDIDMQAATPFLQSTQGLEQLSIPANNGQFIPLSNLITLTPVPTQTDLYHYNRLRAAKISAEIAPGYSLGQVVPYLQKALPSLLPANMQYRFAGQAKQIADANSTLLIIFVLAFVFIYLVLSAQFESFIDPLIILLSVPLSIIGALVALSCAGGSINLYTMIGLVTLVGLIAKHGILITQFANGLQQSGKTAKEALITAASIRLRPILMTTAAMVVGALPLLLASGASAVSRREVGVVFVAGLLFGTFFSLILVPIAYDYFAEFKQWLKVR